MNKIQYLFVGLLLIWLWVPLRAQHTETDSLHGAGSKYGTFDGHARFYGMMTQNAGALTDYYALAAGAGIGYTSPSWHGFDMRFSGFFIFRLSSSDLTERDPITGEGPRYEPGLFDIEDLEKREDMDRLEEFFLRYRFGKSSSIMAGRQLLNSPLINGADGRMRPNLFSAIWFDVKEWKRFGLEGGYIHAVSPRATTSWYSMEESIGLFSQGKGYNGQPAAYKGFVETRGVGVLGLHAEPLPGLKTELWEYWVEGVLHTEFWQTEWKRGGWLLGTQVLHQRSLSDGGNADLVRTYFLPEMRTWLFSTRVQKSWNDWTLQLNGTRIGPNGRFVFPREWGREPLYTFLQRERSEGMANVWALSATASRKLGPFLFFLGTGYYDNPSVQDAWSNKYRIADFIQVNTSIRWHVMDQLDLELIAVRKILVGDTPATPDIQFNRVDMTHVDLIANYYFGHH
jgi:hypothetical protein